MSDRVGLELRRLAVARLPGLADPFAIEAVAGVNLIVGPNESGKSSLVRAVSHLLWPEAPVTTPFDVTAAFADQAGPLHASRLDNGPVTWTRDGDPTAAPPMPAGHLAGCYRLGLLDLNRPATGDVDRELAREVRRQMSGGFDLAAVRERFPDRGATVTRRQRTWRDARAEADACARDHRQLAREVGELGTLADELAAARRAARQRERLTAALEIRELRDQETDLAARLAELPEGTGRVREDDAEELAALDRRIADKIRAASGLRATLAGDETRLAELAVGDGLPLAQRSLEAAVAATADAAETGRELDRADAAVAKARRDVNPELPASGISAEAAAAFSRLAELHRDALRAAARIDHLTALLDATALSEDGTGAPAADQPDDARWDDAMRILADEMPARAPVLGPWGSGLALLAGLATVVSALTAVPDSTVNPVAPVDPAAPDVRLVVLGAVAAIGGAIGLVAWWRARARLARAGQDLEAACAAAGRPLPAGWTRRDAVAHLAAAASERARDQGGAEARVQLREDIARRLATARRDQDAAAARRLALREEWGGEPDPDRPDLLHDLDRLARCRAAETELFRAQEHHAVRITARDAACARTREALAALGENVPAEIPALQSAVDRLRERQAEHRTLLETRTRTRAGLESAEADLAAARDARTGLLTRIDLPALSAATADDGHDPAAVTAMVSDEVRRRVEARPAWDRLTAERQQLNHDLSRALRTLEADDPDGPDSLPDSTATPDELLAAHPDELRDRIAAAAEAAAGVDALVERIADVKARARAARTGDTWAKARAAADTAGADLAEAVAEHRAGLFARILLDAAEERHETVTRPPLLQAADTHLDLFTRGRYRLRLSGGDTEDFVVLDNADRRHGLSELSDGTRAQVLLAARLAFLVGAEAGPAVPLFLDEALTASDPERFDAISGALGLLARQSGRQVFYLTSNPADVAAWQRALDARDLGTAHVVDLDASRRDGAAAAASELELPPLPAVPAPADDTPAAYALRLGVTPVRPWRPTADLDLFHLGRDDLDLVHILARGGVRNVGQWRRHGGALVRAGLISSERQSRLDGRIAVWEAFQGAWRIGRGRPVTAAALEASGALTSTMLDAAREVLDAAAGDGREFMARVRDGEVKRLRQDKKDALQVHLERKGHLDERPVRGPEALVAHVLEAVGPNLRAGVLHPDEVRNLVLELTAAAN